jgi:mycothiol S-conjugate amidase
MNSALRLLAVHAHPDDESSKGAATTARYVDEGVEVIIATATGGERGDLLNKNLVLEPGYNLAEIRKAEMANAVKALGCKHVWLGHMDSGFPEGDPKPPLPKGCFADIDLEVAAAGLVKLIREFKPQVITTYDENGGYPHPDIKKHKIQLTTWICHPGRYQRFITIELLPSAKSWQPIKQFKIKASTALTQIG